MANEQDYQEKALYSWKISAQSQPQRGVWWYILAVIIGLAVLIYAISTANFLFAMMILLIAFIMVLRLYVKNENEDAHITDRGVRVGNTFYSWKQLKSFYIIYEPPAVKKMYLDFRNLRPRLSIEIEDSDPVELRQLMLRLLPENLEEDSESFGDTLERIFKL